MTYIRKKILDFIQSNYPNNTVILQFMELSFDTGSGQHQLQMSSVGQNKGITYEIICNMYTLLFQKHNVPQTVMKLNDSNLFYDFMIFRWLL